MRSIKAGVLGALNMAILGLSTVLAGLAVHLLALLRWVLPLPRAKLAIERFMLCLPLLWSWLAVLAVRKTTGLVVEFRGDSSVLSRGESYLLLPNHQSWTDIFILHDVFNLRISSLRFFMKQSLLYIPLIGSGCFLMGYPFMRRHSQTQMARHPELRGQDLATTRKFCERYREHPVSIISFLEGTRYRPHKAELQQSPYQHLLKPKAGGVAFTLAAMNGLLHQLLDVTIAYQGSRHHFWDYLSGRLRKVIVEVHTQTIPPEMIGDYLQDESFRKSFQAWLNGLWQEKDARLAMLRRELESS